MNQNQYQKARGNNPIQFVGNPATQAQRPVTSGVIHRSGGIVSSQALSAAERGQNTSQGAIPSGTMININNHNKNNSNNIFKMNADNSNNRVSSVSINNKVGAQNSKETKVFYHMNNNFMMQQNGQSQPQRSGTSGGQNGIHSGVGGVAMGQKTAYGFVGGISGQGLNTMTVGSSSGPIGTTQMKQNRNMSSKQNLQQNIQNNIIQVSNSNSQQNQNGQNIPLKKRVFSANRVTSINQQSGNTINNNHQAQQISMQQRRRQQAAYQQRDQKGFQQNIHKGGNMGGPGSASSSNFGTNTLTASQNFQRSTAVKKQFTQQQNANANAVQKPGEDDSFLRGARIAEKIQEYYNTNSSQVSNPQSTGHSNYAGPKQSQLYPGQGGGANLVKQYAGNKQIRTSKGGVFNPAIQNPNQRNSQSNGNPGGRQAYTSHGAGNMRGQSGNVPSVNNFSNNRGVQSQNNGSSSMPNNPEALKGRASSSYGSLQSRTKNIAVSSGSIVKTQHMTNLNKSGISATSGILHQSNYNSSVGAANIKQYYQDGNAANSTFDRIVTIGSNSNLNNTVVMTNVTQIDPEITSSPVNDGPEGGNNRPITRDIKHRSQANRGHNSCGGVSGQINGLQAAKTEKQIQDGEAENYNNVDSYNKNMSALSGNEQQILDKAANGTQTFQHTINIGSFINEINNQQILQKSQNHITNEEIPDAAQNKGGITTFSNTIENTDESMHDNRHKQKIETAEGVMNQSSVVINQNAKTQQDNIEGTKLNSILNTGTQGSTEMLKSDNNTANGITGIGTAHPEYQKSVGSNMNVTAGRNPQQMANGHTGNSVQPLSGQQNRMRNQSQNNIMYIHDGSGAVVEQKDQEIRHSDEPVIKIQNQTQNQGSKTATQSNQSNLQNQDIRQIKLNYIQLNKRVTTANNNQAPNGRKIPQKQQQNYQAPSNEYQNIQISGTGANATAGGQRSRTGTAGVQGKSNFMKTQNQYSNVYQDGQLQQNQDNANPSNMAGFRNTVGPGGLGAYDNPVQNAAHLQNQYRHLQTRQTRRIITSGNTVSPGQNSQPRPNGSAPATEELGRGQHYVQQHIQQQQHNAAHIAQTHAMAYQVEKYKDEQGQEHQNSIDQQNQFCTDGSHIENIDNYIIGKRIGQGAYAVVRVGLHKVLNQKIAVKIYEKFKLLEPNRRKSVKREIKIMEKIDHECLAKLYEAFESHKQVFLIMEYVNGGSLHGYLKGKPNRQMAEIEAKFLWQQVVFGIHYLHQRNVTHRDIKLENILLDETRTRVKLIDFGFSTCIPHEKKVKIFCGTPSYMAPEIVSKIEYAGPPVDVWALGVLLYALLCGRFPFKGQNDKELYSNICKKELPLPDHISRPARQLLLRIFHKTPEKRPSCKDILRDPWLQFSPRDQEMMSPKSMSFVQYLRKISNINFGTQNAQQSKIGLNKTISGFSRSGIGESSIDYTSAIAFQLQSKDKRHQLHASDVKQFITEDNGRRNFMIQKKQQMQSVASEQGHHHGSFALYAQSLQKAGSTGGNQAFDDNNFVINQNDGRGRYTLNDTMPVGGLGSSSLNMIRQSSLENGLRAGAQQQAKTPAQNNNLMNDPQNMSDQPFNDVDSNSNKRLNSKINMEAYQAYYNTNDSQQQQAIVDQNPTDTQKDDIDAKAIVDDKIKFQNPNNGEAVQAGHTQNMKIINNIMHINHSGANINIMCGNQNGTQESGPNVQNNGAQQNNFIFNHTAPINLNM